MTTTPDTTSIDSAFTDELEIENALVGRFGTVRPFQNPITAADVAAENYATESLVLSVPREETGEEP